MSHLIITFPLHLHCPVVRQEEKGDGDWEEEGHGHVLQGRPQHGPTQAEVTGWGHSYAVEVTSQHDLRN